MIVSKHRISKESLRASGQVQSLSRALRLLNTLADYSQGLSLSEVAHSVGLPTSTAHRLLTTLQNERYVKFDSERSLWLIGVQAFRVGTAFMSSRDLAAVAKPFMRRLMEQTGETVSLGVVDRSEIVFVLRLEAQKVLRAINASNVHQDLVSSAVGKAILAYMHPEEREKILKTIKMQSGITQLPKSVQITQHDLQAIRARGFSVNSEENAGDLKSAASAVFDEHGFPLGAVCVCGMASAMTESKLQALGEAVRGIASEITLELGGCTPESIPA
ncbi:MAG: IclR family transcriptional regulator [Hyphomicrobiales bacterium]